MARSPQIHRRTLSPRQRSRVRDPLSRARGSLIPGIQATSRGLEFHVSPRGKNGPPAAQHGTSVLLLLPRSSLSGGIWRQRGSQTGVRLGWFQDDSKRNQSISRGHRLFFVSAHNLCGSKAWLHKGFTTRVELALGSLLIPPGIVVFHLVRLRTTIPESIFATAEFNCGNHLSLFRVCVLWTPQDICGFICGFPVWLPFSWWPPAVPLAFLAFRVQW